MKHQNSTEKNYKALFFENIFTFWLPKLIEINQFYQDLRVSTNN